MHLLATLQKYRSFRERGPDYLSFHKKSVLSQPSIETVLDSAKKLEDEMKQKYISTLLQQLDTVSKTIYTQSNIIQHVHHSISERSTMMTDLVGVMNKIEEQLLLEPTKCPQIYDLDAHNEKLSTNISAARAGLNIISEMRSHMTMHRQLLKRKSELLSQFPAESFPTEKHRRKTTKKKVASLPIPCEVKEVASIEAKVNEGIADLKGSPPDENFESKYDTFDLMHLTDLTDEDGNLNFLDFSFHDYS